MLGMLVKNPNGNYSFIRGIAPYSGGVVAQPGFEIVHARFQQPLVLQRSRRFLRITRIWERSACVP